MPMSCFDWRMLNQRTFKFRDPEQPANKRGFRVVLCEGDMLADGKIRFTFKGLELLMKAQGK